MARGGSRTSISSVLVAGVQGDRYGCRHDSRSVDSNFIASLRPNALDDDTGQLFGVQTLPIDISVRACAGAVLTETDDDFDSGIFEIFDRVSVASHRGTYPQPSCRVRNAAREAAHRRNVPF